MKKCQDNSAPCKTATTFAKHTFLRRIKGIYSLTRFLLILVIVEQKHPIDNAHSQVGY